MNLDVLKQYKGKKVQIFVAGRAQPIHGFLQEVNDEEGFVITERHIPELLKDVDLAIVNGLSIELVQVMK